MATVSLVISSATTVSTISIDKPCLRFQTTLEFHWSLETGPDRIPLLLHGLWHQTVCSGSLVKDLKVLRGQEQRGKNGRLKTEYGHWMNTDKVTKYRFVIK